MVSHLLLQLLKVRLVALTGPRMRVARAGRRVDAACALLEAGRRDL